MSKKYKNIRRLKTDIFKAFFGKEFKRFFNPNPLKDINELSQTEIDKFSNYLSNQNKYKDNWYFIENKLRTFYRYHNRNTEKLLKIISKTIKHKEKEIDILHRLYIEEMLQSNEKSYFMITISPKRQSNILDGVGQVLNARKEIASILKEHTRYRKIKNRYIHIPEISKNKKVHLHSYFYFQISDDELEELKSKIKRKLNMNNYDVNIQKLDINYKFAKNYSSFENNLLKKIGQMPKRARIIYFFLMKMFGKRRFITHSRILSFKKLRRCMAYLIQRGVKISYFYLIKGIISSSNNIKVFVGNKRVNLAFLYLLSENINLLFPPPK